MSPPPRPAAPPPAAKPAQPAPPSSPSSSTNLKDALLAEIRKTKMVFYNTVIAQAQKIEVAADSVTFTFSPNHRTLRDVFEQNRAWIESAAQQVSGRRIAITSVQNDPAAGAAAPPAAEKKPPDESDKKSALREQAMADAGVQAMLEVFPAEIRDVEEM
jgi:hypothetical protein